MDTVPQLLGLARDGALQFSRLTGEQLEAYARTFAVIADGIIERADAGTMNVKTLAHIAEEYGVVADPERHNNGDVAWNLLIGDEYVPCKSEQHARDAAVKVGAAIAVATSSTTPKTPSSSSNTKSRANC